jgi:hypothetical protein
MPPAIIASMTSTTTDFEPLAGVELESEGKGPKCTRNGARTQDELD